MKLSQVGVQLYTLRNECQTSADFAASMKRVRQIGYSAVQVSSIGPIPEDEILRILDGEGLVCCATHEAGDVIRKQPEEAIERLQKLKCNLTAYPYPAGVDMADPASLGSLIDDLNAAGEKMAAAGITLAYHNHAIEFVKTDGMTALDRIYGACSPEFLHAELDTYWIHYGGGENVSWCRKLAGRLPILHLKDYSFTIENQPNYCEIGNGTLDFQAILAAADASGCKWYVVEQDSCPGDPFDSIRKSFDYIQANLVS